VKSIRNNKLLGIAVGEKAMLIAEVHCSGERCDVQRVAHFTYAAGQSLQQPEALGRSLGDFLRAQNFGVRRAVFGLPAKWVLTKLKEVPAVDDGTVADMLRLQSEGEFSPELKDLVYDYAGKSSSSHESVVMLVATPRKHIEQITVLAEGAKVAVVGVTASVAALAAATSRVKKDALVLSLTSGGAELAAQRGSTPAVLRHVGPASAATAPLLMGELRRAASTVSQNGNGLASGGLPSTNGDSRRELILWDDLEAGGARVASDLAVYRNAGESAGLDVTEGEIGVLGVTADQAVPSRGAAVAVALAIEGMQRRLTIDFLHTRLAPPKEQRFDQRIIVGALAAVLVAVLIVAAFLDIHAKQGKLEDLRAQELKQAPLAKTRQAFVDRVEYAQTFRNAQTSYLDCLKDLTTVLPDDGQTFVTNFTLHDNHKGVLTGKSNNGASVVNVLAKLNANKHFNNVELLDQREQNREVSFSIAFIYDPTGGQHPPDPKTAGNRGAVRTVRGR
jgi:hypothetical protein